MQRTFIMFKPDAVERGVVGEILSRFERKGLVLAGLKLLHVSDAQIKEHYKEHEGKPFLPGLIQYIQSGPVIAGVLVGKDAVATVRRLLGATDPGKADVGTIRGDYGQDISRNLVHGSDSPESAEREIAIYFTPDEVSPQLPVRIDQQFEASPRTVAR
ncbi:MAG TPA: nucleoside-diphosphate kinase [bacterium]|nr:nucleoside-diphosphate kinase [bacterium]